MTSTVNEGECEIVIENPMLWWPHGHGEQFLYQVEVRLVKDGKVIDQRHYQTGLRTMELIQEKDEWGTSFYFKINGVPVYMKGADYIPEDNIPVSYTHLGCEACVEGRKKYNTY